MGILHDTPDYVRTLTWLGKPLPVGQETLLLRPLPMGLADARGNWPYQFLPSANRKHPV